MTSHNYMVEFKIDNSIILSSPSTLLSSAVAAAGTALTVINNAGFANADLLLYEGLGTEKAESKKVNAAVTAGTTLTSSAVTFAHSTGSSIAKILFDQVQILGASTVGGSKTSLATIDLTFDQLATSYVWTGTAYNFYFIRYYNSSSTEYSSYSDALASTGTAIGSVGYLVQSVLRNTKQELGKGGVTQEWFIDEINDCLNYIRGKLKTWSNMQSFDYVLGQTSRGTWKFALPSTMYDVNTNKSVSGVRLDNRPELVWQNKNDFNIRIRDLKNSLVTTEAAVGQTTLAIDNSYDFADDGSVNVYISNSQITLTYTGVTRSATAGVLTGIPASGTGSITSTIPAATNVWQDETEEEPRFYTIYDGNIYLWPLVTTDYDNMNIFLDYFTKVTAVDSMGDTLEFPRYDAVKHWLQWKIRGFSSGTGELDRNDTDFLMFDDITKAMIKNELTGKEIRWKPRLNSTSYPRTYNDWQFLDS